MGWEKRNGKDYFYLKMRDGNRVDSIYVGNNLRAHLIHRKMELERAAEAAVQEENTAIRKTNTELEALHKLVNKLANAALLMKGYHTHKGEWRKKRG